MVRCRECGAIITYSQKFGICLDCKKREKELAKEYENKECCGTCYKSYYDEENILRCPEAPSEGELMVLKFNYGTGCSIHKFKDDDGYFVIN